VRYGQAIPAQAVIAPMTSGYDPALKTEMSDHDVARAKALLDLHGYVDQNGDGWRDQPGGVALVLEYSSQPDQLSRKLQEVLKKSFDAVNVKIEFKIAKWPEQLKSSRAGKLMMWGSGWGGANPDGQYFMAQTKARPTTRALTCRPSTLCTKNNRCCPTDRSAKR
jgi:ABC-type transport system substrate-binding protein